jgi:CheY-like chemotaxis protein
MLPKMHTSATVLVVENDPITRELLENVLQTAGYQVLAVPTANAGLLALCQQRTDINWLVTRMKLPGLVDGWLLADEFHQHNPGRPAILLSEAISETDCPSVDAVLVPPQAPMRVLEALKGLVLSEAVHVAPVAMSWAA